MTRRIIRQNHASDALAGADLNADDSAAAALTGDDRIPDFSGLSLRRAFALAGRRHLNLEVEGDGYVVAQRPRPVRRRAPAA